MTAMLAGHKQESVFDVLKHFSKWVLCITCNKMANYYREISNYPRKLVIYSILYINLEKEVA